MLARLKALLDLLPPIDKNDRGLIDSDKTEDPYWQQIFKDINFTSEIKKEKESKQTITYECFLFEMETQGISRDEALKIFNWPYFQIIPTIMQVVNLIYDSYSEHFKTSKENVSADDYFPCLVDILSQIHENDLRKLSLITSHLIKFVKGTEEEYYLTTVLAAAEAVNKKKLEPLDDLFKKFLDKKFANIPKDQKQEVDYNFKQLKFLQKMHLVFQYMQDSEQRVALPILQDLGIRCDALRASLEAFIKQKLPLELRNKLFPKTTGRMPVTQDVSHNLEVMDKLSKNVEVMESDELKLALEHYVQIRKMQQLLINPFNTPLQRLKEFKEFFSANQSLSPLKNNEINVHYQELNNYVKMNVLAEKTKIAPLLAQKFNRPELSKTELDSFPDFPSPPVSSTKEVKDSKHHRVIFHKKK